MAVSSNYRAARRGRSRAEFSAKLGTVLEEADESQHWLEMLGLMGLADDQLPRLVEEADELVRIFSASCRTAKRRCRQATHRPNVEASPDHEIRSPDHPIKKSPDNTSPDRRSPDR
jgi:hypothetical protein